MRTLLARLRTSWLSGLTHPHRATGPTVHVSLPPTHAATVRCSGGRRGRLGARSTSAVTARPCSAARPPPAHGPERRRLAGRARLPARRRTGRSVVEVDAPDDRRTDVWTFGVSGRPSRHLRCPGYLTLLGYDGDDGPPHEQSPHDGVDPGSAPTYVVARAAGWPSTPARPAVHVGPGTGTGRPASPRRGRRSGRCPRPRSTRARLSRWRVRRGARIGAATPAGPPGQRRLAGVGMEAAPRLRATAGLGGARTASCRCCGPARAGRCCAADVGRDCTRVTALFGDPLSLPGQVVSSCAVAELSRGMTALPSGRCRSRRPWCSRRWRASPTRRTAGCAPSRGPASTSAR